MRHVLVVLLYLGIALALGAPLLARLATGLPHDAIDPLLNTWILWWDASRWPFTSSWWDAPAFFPSESPFAFSEHLVALSVLTTPLLWLTSSPVAAYNLAWLLSFVLSALAAYGLALHLAGRRDAAFLAGLAYGFAPYRAAQAAHLQVLSAYGMPVALLALHRYVHSRQVRWLGLFGAAYLWQALANSYYLFFFPVLVGLWVLWFAARRGGGRTVAAISLAQVLAALVLLPVLLRYRAVHEHYGFARDPDEVLRFSADLASWLQASDLLVLWRWLGIVIRPEGELFPGATLPTVLLVGVLAAWRRVPPASDSTWVRRGRRAAAVVAAAGAGAALLRWFDGRWPLAIGSYRFDWGSDPATATVGLAGCLLLWTALHPRTRSAAVRRSPLAFYALAAGVLWVLALGPVGRWFGEPVVAPLPYAWLLALPGFSTGLRVPARFWMLALLALSAAVALAFTKFAPERGWPRLLVTGLVAAGLVADGWFTVLVADVPAPSCAEQAIVPHTDDRMRGVRAALYLPLGRPADDVAAMYRARWRGVPTVNGYSGYFPPHYGPLVWAAEQRDRTILDFLAERDPLAVVIDTARDENGAWQAFVESHPRAARLAQCGGTLVYRVQPPESPGQTTAPMEDGRRVPIARLQASVNADRLGLATDGNLRTRWDTGPQQPDQWLVIELTAPVRPRALVMDLGPYRQDFPRVLLVDSSVDRQQWTREWEGSTAVLAVAGALADPRRVPIVVPLRERPARYLRLRQTSSDPVYYWSVAELSVLAARN